nr:unnamed protein product [Digitaria exilis]
MSSMLNAYSSAQPKPGPLFTGGTRQARSAPPPKTYWIAAAAAAAGDRGDRALGRRRHGGVDLIIAVGSGGYRTSELLMAGFGSLAPKTRNLVVAGGLSAFVLGVYYYTMRAVGGTDELQVAIDKFEEMKKKDAGNSSNAGS